MFKPFQIIMFNTINTVNWLFFLKGSSTQLMCIHFANSARKTVRGFTPFTNFASRASGYPNLKNQILHHSLCRLLGTPPLPGIEIFFAKLFQAALLRSLCFYKNKTLYFVSRTIVRRFYNISFLNFCQGIRVLKIKRKAEKANNPFSAF